jgi:hypothetical protein
MPDSNLLEINNRIVTIAGNLSPHYPISFDSNAGRKAMKLNAMEGKVFDQRRELKKNGRARDLVIDNIYANSYHTHGDHTSMIICRTPLHQHL